jgi:hypothetical protein
MNKSDIIFKAIKLIYPQIEGGYVFGENPTNPADGLFWENKIFPKPKWEDIQKLIPQIQLEDAKAHKINELKANFDVASKKPLKLKGVKQIDKNGKVIRTVDAYYNIADVNSLNDSVNIIFAGTFIKMQAFLKVLCASLKIDYNAILTQVNGLSDNANGANIPYTTKDTKGNEIRVLLSFANIQDIFAHIFLRVANASNSYNIIEEQIKKALTPEELEAIDIDINKRLK